MRMSTKHRGRLRIGLTSLAGSAALVAVGAVMVAMLAGASGAQPTWPRRTLESRRSQERLALARC